VKVRFESAKHIKTTASSTHTASGSMR